MKNLIKICTVVCILNVGLMGFAQATTVILSTTETETLGGIKFTDGSLVEYEICNGSKMVLDEDKCWPNADIDAAGILDNGHYVLSFENEVEIDNQVFRDGDLIEVDGITCGASLFFSEDLFDDDENIDAVCVLDNGHIILSTETSAKLGGTLLDPGDLVEYDPITDVGTLFLNQEEHFITHSPNIDAVCVLDSDNIILSTSGMAMLGDLPFQFGPADLVRYNSGTKTAEIILDASEKFPEYVSYRTDIDAVYIPEPATIALFGLGALSLVLRRRKA